MKLFLVVFNVLVLVNFGCYGFLDKLNSDVFNDSELNIDPEERTSNYWFQNAQNTLHEKLQKDENRNVAKNVIFFLGDGMSIPTITASRIYKGQLQNKNGEESKLFFETFPYVGLSKTYCVDKQVADSACSATAYLCGVKANFATIGVTAKVPLNECPLAENHDTHVHSIATWAQNAGKGTGIVTTTRITHASPAGNYAHVASRDYESDADIHRLYNKTGHCLDIAYQLIKNDTGRRFNVIMGGGRQKLLPKQNEYGFSGERLDGLNLINEWKNYKKSLNSNYKFVHNKETLNSVDYNKTDYLLGLFNDKHLDFHLDANPDIQPTLVEMTESAIKILQKHDKGFYLFVEGGRIDSAHHQNKVYKALDETVEFDKAIEKAVQMTSRDDTLIIVTADHAHVMTLNGYSTRGKNILGLNSQTSDKDKKPYTTLSYANGPGYVPSSSRPNLTNFVIDKDTEYPSAVPLEYETHGGDDVGVFAIGPWSHLFTGVYEENLIPHLLAYASCIGPSHYTACNYSNTN